MCDTLVIIRPDRVWFAKNSDRDPNEAQCLYWQPAQDHSAGSRLQCTYVEIPQVEVTHAVVLSRPFWMWGAEMGANEHGVCIGNEAVFTSQPLARIGLTGMDLVRLGIERSKTAKAALETIIQLLEVHGQGGGCGLENRAFSYHNSFLIADPSEAYVLETAGKFWAQERVTGVRSISNGLTIPGFAEKHSDTLRSRIAQCRVRQARTSQLGNDVSQTSQLMSLLRDHGSEGLRYSIIHGALSGPCAHAGGLIAATQTTASWVADLSASHFQHWATATSTPCLSLFKPVQVEEPVELGPWPNERHDPNSYWWWHEQLFRAMCYASAEYGRTRDALEQRWLNETPASKTAFAEAEAWITQHVVSTPDQRPWYVRRYWSRRNKKAGLPGSPATTVSIKY